MWDVRVGVLPLGRYRRIGLRYPVSNPHNLFYFRTAMNKVINCRKQDLHEALP